jgi:SAM-dependent methyltransferase
LLYQAEFDWFCDAGEFREVIAPVLRKYKPARALDLGCGSSTVAEQLAAFGVRVVDAVDSSPEVVAQMLQRQQHPSAAKLADDDGDIDNRGADTGRRGADTSHRGADIGHLGAGVVGYLRKGMGAAGPDSRTTHAVEVTSHTGEVRYSLVDITSRLPFEDGAFDLIIDKGAYACLNIPPAATLSCFHGSVCFLSGTTQYFELMAAKPCSVSHIVCDAGGLMINAKQIQCSRAAIAARLPTSPDTSASQAIPVKNFLGFPPFLLFHSSRIHAFNLFRSALFIYLLFVCLFVCLFIYLF